jgi:DNA (cytosine-5)-methyltransferase 1
VTRPRLLDLFSGAGGAARGYHRAGFDVVGVDIVAQPHYPFQFHQADALNVLRDMACNGEGVWHGQFFQAIHASPPCQGYTTQSNRWKHRPGALVHTRPLLIAETMELLKKTGLPYVLENVMGASASMASTLVLHGGQFGLNVYRPRLFESNVMILAPAPAPAPADLIGVYGRAPDGRRLNTRATGTIHYAAASLEQAQEAMGMDWGDWHGVKEAIPPAYTEFIGAQLMNHLAMSA